MEISPVLTPLAFSDRPSRNRRLGVKLGLVSLFFVGFGFAMVPLYDVICDLTGLNGKTNTSPMQLDRNTQVDTSRSVKVEFLSHSMPGVGLTVKPDQFSIPIHPGAMTIMNYTVTNHRDQVFVGQAIPSITPAAAAAHFEKIECFCFQQQSFQPGETRTLPVVFVVNPKISRDLSTLTLSYAFFEAIKPKN